MSHFVCYAKSVQARDCDHFFLTCYVFMVLIKVKVIKHDAEFFEEQVIITCYHIVDFLNRFPLLFNGYSLDPNLSKRNDWSSHSNWV